MREYDCPRCGEFAVSLTGAEAIERLMNARPDAWVRLSFAVRKRANQRSTGASLVLLDSDVVERLAQSPLPSEPERRWRLLAWLEAERQRSGQLHTVIVEPIELAAVLGVSVTEEVVDELRAAERDGDLVQVMAEAGMLTTRVSTQGRRLLEAPVGAMPSARPRPAAPSVPTRSTWSWAGVKAWARREPIPALTAAGIGVAIVVGLTELGISAVSGIASLYAEEPLAAHQLNLLDPGTGRPGSEALFTVTRSDGGSLAKAQCRVRVPPKFAGSVKGYEGPCDREMKLRIVGSPIYRALDARTSAKAPSQVRFWVDVRYPDGRRAAAVPALADDKSMLVINDLALSITGPTHIALGVPGPFEIRLGEQSLGERFRCDIVVQVGEARSVSPFPGLPADWSAAGPCRRDVAVAGVDGRSPAVLHARVVGSDNEVYGEGIQPLDIRPLLAPAD